MSDVATMSTTKMSKAMGWKVQSILYLVFGVFFFDFFFLFCLNFHSRKFVFFFHWVICWFSLFWFICALRSVCLEFIKCTQIEYYIFTYNTSLRWKSKQRARACTHRQQSTARNIWRENKKKYYYTLPYILLFSSVCILLSFVVVRRRSRHLRINRCIFCGLSSIICLR